MLLAYTEEGYLIPAEEPKRHKMNTSEMDNSAELVMNSNLLAVKPEFSIS